VDHTEKAYSTKEVSLTLGIGDSTLRKWCLALEKNAYKFLRNDRDQRLYVESDLVVLKHFQKLVQDHNMQLENAAALVVDRFGKGAFEPGTGIVPVEKEEERRDLERSNSEVIQQLQEHIRTQQEYMERQELFNQGLLKRLDQQQKYIEERLDVRDQTLLESLREVQETKKLIATAQEKKGFLARLFNK
jgi:DNA-binding transcriptional MerR regulator